MIKFYSYVWWISKVDLGNRAEQFLKYLNDNLSAVMLQASTNLLEKVITAKVW